jgi:uncharacterized protein
VSDLSDAEFDELDALLAGTPEPYRPLDAVMLDGYLCGVLVQPRLVERIDWLPPIFDLDGAALPARAEREWRSRCEALVERRHDALRRALEDQGGFDPLLAESDDAAEAIRPWLAGFEHALRCFADLAALPDAEVQRTLAKVLAAEAGIDDLVQGVAELYDETHARRWRVETVRRAAPKVGRNEPCPCGSGRKFKLCHGAR